MIISILFYGFLAYLLYRLVFNFILPVYRATRQVRKGFQEMNERMNQQHEYQQNGTGTQSTHQSAGNKPNDSKIGEYIDFEEIKE